MASRLCTRLCRQLAAARCPRRPEYAVPVHTFTAEGASTANTPWQGRRLVSAAATAGSISAAAGSQVTEAPAEDSHLLQTILSGILAPYWENTPTAEAVVNVLESRYPDAAIGFDHFAFRTFGVEGLGILSVASLFTDFGYQQRDPLDFPAKKLRAYWYAPPDPELPRVFISEIKVEELSPAAQGVIRKYTAANAALLGKYGLMSALMGVQPWPCPSLEDFELLAQESEYAAWVLVNGYALNHTTISVHRLQGHSGGIEALNSFMQEQGFVLNAEGGATKASPDGLLLQSSTVADRVSFCFQGGQARLVPGSYIEFAERLVLPQFRGLKPEEVEEHHRRDGFEASSADKIFESTTLAAEQQQ